VISGALFCALDGDSEGVGQPRNEVGVNRGSGFGVVFANDPNGPALRKLGDIKLCVGVFWHGRKRGSGDKKWVKGRKSGLQFDVVVVFMAPFYLGSA
jgi:hypothetical protein